MIQRKRTGWELAIQRQLVTQCKLRQWNQTKSSRTEEWIREPETKMLPNSQTKREKEKGESSPKEKQGPVSSEKGQPFNHIEKCITSFAEDLGKEDKFCKDWTSIGGVKFCRGKREGRRDCECSNGYSNLWICVREISIRNAFTTSCCLRVLEKKTVLGFLLCEEAIDKT